MGILLDLTLNRKILILITIQFFFSFNLNAQTIEEVSNKMKSLTKEELKEVDQSITTIKNRVTEKLKASLDGKNGQIFRKYEVFDSTGKKVSGREIEWTYYPGMEGKRPVDIITIKELDSNDKVVKIKKIKHWPDGRVEEIK